MSIFKTKEYSGKEFIYIVWITFMAVFLRILWISKVICIPESDFKVYHDIASNIYMYNTHSYLGKPIAFQGMAYPVILGIFYKVIGSNSIIAAKIFNVLLSCITCGLIFYILNKLLDKKYLILISYTITVLLPSYIAYNNVLGTETLSLLIFTAIISLQISSINNIIKSVLLGIFIAIASLIKPFFLVYPIVIAFTQWITHKNLGKVIKECCIMMAVCIAVVAPWAYRNYRIFKSIIPVSYNGGYVLFINNNSDNTTGKWMQISKIKISSEFEKKLEEKDFHYGSPRKQELEEIFFNPKVCNLLGVEGKKWIISHPKEFMKLGFIRIKNTFFSGAEDIFMWTMYGNSLDESHLNLFKRIFNPIIYVISTLGIVLSLYHIKDIFICLFKREKKMDYTLAIATVNILYFLLITFVFEGQPRYDFLVLFIFVVQIMCSAPAR